MLITCSGCSKKLNVPENLSGKKVRCPGCKTVIPVPDGQVVAVTAPPPIPQAVPAAAEVSQAPAIAAVPASTVSTMRCAACKAAVLQPLPANLYSRRPGYVCSACRAVMRTPGSTSTCVIAIIFGCFTILLGLVMGVVILTSDTTFRVRKATGGFFLAGLGALVAGWGIKQLMLPIPLDAPTRPSQLKSFVIILAIVLMLGLLVCGGGLFFFLYYLHEMM
jgi:DNA-directed RNA polymerase subunit RPC12/RpoP